LHSNASVFSRFCRRKADEITCLAVINKKLIAFIYFFKYFYVSINLIFSILFHLAPTNDLMQSSDLCDQLQEVLRFHMHTLQAICKENWLCSSTRYECTATTRESLLETIFQWSPCPHSEPVVPLQKIHLTLIFYSL